MTTNEEIIVLDTLFQEQALLDKEIMEHHQVEYSETTNKRILALLVELGEFANETRCFKFWSFKGPSPKDVILEEYVDGLHFFLSLGIPLGVERLSHRFRKDGKDLTEQILLTYDRVLDLLENYEAKTYALAFSSFLNILPHLGYKVDDVFAAYEKKRKINEKRQEANY